MAKKQTHRRLKPLAGFFLTFEGIEGSGKSTQIRRVYEWLQNQYPGREIVLTREPGGTPLADRIRNMLLAVSSNAKTKKTSARTAPAIDAETELFLYEAARRDHIEEIVRPALLRKAIVLCDRFTDSTVAYQGYGRGLPLRRIETLNRVASGGLKPDATFLFDLPVATGLSRARSRSKAMDRLDLESKSFHERVRKGFLSLARREKRRFKVLDARRPLEHVFSRLKSHLGRALEKKI